VKSAIDELEHAVMRLGLKGAELDTHVNGSQWDEPKFLPFFKAAEQMGAVLFYHPQPQANFLIDRMPRHGLSTVSASSSTTRSSPRF
jgi:predicted TIM-barrel fold metal-dependent hydrolase